MTMVAFYATSFDAIALVASAYSYRELTQDEDPHMAVKVFWSLMLILLPMALVFSDNSMANLQTVAIIAAFPHFLHPPADHRRLPEGREAISVGRRIRARLAGTVDRRD